MTTCIELLQTLLTCPQPLEPILNQLRRYPWDSGAITTANLKNSQQPGRTGYG